MNLHRTEHERGQVGSAPRAASCPSAEARLQHAVERLLADDPEEAIRQLDAAPEMLLTEARAWLVLGAARRRLGDERGAEMAYRRALAIDDTVPEAHYNLGQALARERPREAIAHLRCALRLRPAWPEAENALGVILLRRARYTAARAAFRRAAAAGPRWSIPHLNLGELALAQGDPEEALESFDRALLEEPSSARAHSNRAYALLQKGDLAAGWRALEWRFGEGPETPARPGFDVSVWRGEPFPGRTLVVWMEQGLGDALQFVRFLPAVAKLGGRVWLQTSPALSDLLATCPGVDRVLVGDPRPEEVDLQIPLLSIPGRLGASLDTLSAQIPYLKVPGPRAARARRLSAAAGDVKVGLVWRSGPLAPQGSRRDLDDSALAALLAVPGVHWFAAQHDEPLRARCPALPPDLDGRLTDLAFDLGDFAQTAAIVEQLDLIVTVDTAMAHLAGALGLPTWVLLPNPADWRWLLDRDDSPWYPSMRLFRQRRRGSWDEPIRRVAAALRDHDERG